MNWRKILGPVAATIIVFAGYRAWGWPGVALAAGGLVFWLLLHFNRIMQALQRAARRPIGQVGSAVMLNAKLRPGVNLLHVIALTRSLGSLQSPEDAQPEVFRWSDGSDSNVTCEFRNGKLVKWELFRPGPENAGSVTDRANPAAPGAS